MKFGSLFSGIGGGDKGLEDAGMECAVQVERDAACLRVLERHWPDVRRLTDVNTAAGEELGATDLLIGGFPCQDLSVAGKRAGLAGERSGLFFQFARLIAECAPRWVVIENVPGLLSSNRGQDMAVVVGTLAELGYGWAYRVLDAQYFGVPQRRRRVFIVGCAGDPARAAQVLFEPESVSGDSPPRREARQRLADSLTVGANQYSGFPGEPVEVAGTLGGGSGSRGWAPDTDHMTFLPEYSHPLTTPSGQRWEPTSETYIIKGAAIGRDPSAGPQYGEILSDGSTYTLNATEVHAVAVGYHENLSGNVTTDDVAKALRSGASKSYQGVITIGKGSDPLWSEDVAQPVTGRNGNPGSIQEGMVVRRLTPLECERLQGFPDGWTSGESDSARYKMLGNAMAVPVVAWIGRRIFRSHHDV